MPFESARPVPLAVSVAGTTVTVEFTVNVVALVIARTVGFGGFVVSPAPAIPIPTERPVVLAQLIVGLVPSEQPVSETPAAVSESPVPLPVAATLITKVVEFVIELMAAVPAMFAPLTLIPGMSPVVLAQVTVVVPFVVQFVSTMGTVRLPVEPRSFTSAAARTLVAVHVFIAPASPPVVEAFEKIS